MEDYYMEKLYKRELYLSKIRPFYKDEDMIKVLTGVRRCGKSSIMQLICNELIENGVSKRNIAYINLDKRPYKGIKTPSIPAFWIAFHSEQFLVRSLRTIARSLQAFYVCSPLIISFTAKTWFLFTIMV